MVESNWFFRPSPRPTARLRLFCFHHAGGGAAAYRSWPAELPPSVDVWAVQTPGRGWRLREPALGSVSALADEAWAAISPVLDRPFAFFGHSAGAVLAFEVARRAAREGREPSALFVSARRAAGLQGSDPPLAGMSDEDFVEAIDRRYGGIPVAVRKSPEMMELLLPTLRADIRALTDYAYAGGSPLSCAIHALGGTEDGTVDEAELRAWATLTHGAFRCRMFPGDHFFVETARPRVLDFVMEGLAAHDPDGSAVAELSTSPTARGGSEGGYASGDLLP